MTEVFALLAALFGGGLVAAVVQLLRVKTQNQADLSTAWSSFVEPLQAELASLRTRVAHLEAKNAEQGVRIDVLEEENRSLKIGVSLLTRQILAGGNVPAWHPFEDLTTHLKEVTSSD